MNTNKTIEEKIKELLPKKKDMNTVFYDEDGYTRENAKGYNQALDEVLLALPAIKNAIYEEVWEKIEELKKEINPDGWDDCLSSIQSLTTNK